MIIFTLLCAGGLTVQWEPASHPARGKKAPFIFTESIGSAVATKCAT